MRSVVTETLPVRRWDGFGERIPEHDFLVFNEREVRASAGILFAFGMTGFITALNTSDFRIGQAFAVFFLVDMMIRLVGSPQYSPTLALGRIAVYWQRPEWVSAAPKKFAWGLGFALALVTCFAFGTLQAPIAVVLALCGICLAFLFAEAALGICVGCLVHQALYKTKPEMCPGDSCDYHPAGKRA